MSTLCTKSWNDYKSPLRVVVQFLQRSLEAKTRKCNELKLELQMVRQQPAQHEKVTERQRHEIRQLEEQNRRLEAEKQQGICRLPDDPSIATHGYGARMVSLAVNLAKAVGLRGAERVLKVMFEWLEVEQKVPDFTTIRTWLQRLGVAAVEEGIEQAGDWIWMVDHSNQIGPEKVLAVLGVRASELPPPGIPLKHADVHVLTVQAGTDWKRKNMEAAYDGLVERYGPPRALLMDGAAELREAAKGLKEGRLDTIVLNDFKHKAANLFKAILGNDEQFTEFMSRVGRTRSAIQQTELAHLSPPSVKQKARFMNMKSRLRWAKIMLWLLEHPEAETRRWMTAERLEEKLGWLRSFADDLPVWCECEEVIEKGVTFINEQGLFRGATDGLRELIGSASHAVSRQLATKLIDFVAAAECQLNEGERLPMSTEILESSFSLYKQLEGQHSKCGFTSLLASFGSLLKPQTPEMIRRAFSRVSVQDVKKWVDKNLGLTLTSKRRATYNEFNSSKKSANVNTATV